jgi:hypothetical protein
MLTPATAAAFALEDVSLVAELLAAEVGDREAVLTPGDAARVIRLSVELRRMMAEWENSLPKTRSRRPTLARARAAGHSTKALTVKFGRRVAADEYVEACLCAVVVTPFGDLVILNEDLAGDADPCAIVFAQ